MAKRTMKTEDRHNAQDYIMNAILSAALTADERGEASTADAIRELASQLARKYGINNIPGLPTTCTRA